MRTRTVSLGKEVSLYEVLVGACLARGAVAAGPAVSSLALRGGGGRRVQRYLEYTKTHRPFGGVVAAAAYTARRALNEGEGVENRVVSNTRNTPPLEWFFSLASGRVGMRNGA